MTLKSKYMFVGVRSLIDDFTGESHIPTKKSASSVSITAIAAYKICTFETC